MARPGRSRWTLHRRCLLATASSLLAALAAGAVGCTDYDVQAGLPELSLSAELIDFGQVVLGNQSTIGIEVQNTGLGDLVIESAELDGTTSPDFSFVDLSAYTIPKGQSAELKVRYVPDVIGQDYGRVALTTNDAAHPIANVDLTGFGVEPQVDLDPDILYFGQVAPGDSAALSFTVSAGGVGTLRITDLQLDTGLDAAYTVALPPGVVLPYEMPTGVSMEVLVTFSPPTDAQWRGELTLSTNDPGARQASVELIGNSEDDPTVDSPPVVSISDPDWGEYFLTSDTPMLTGVVVDEEDPAESLACLGYAGTALLGAATPDSSGNVVIPVVSLPLGEVELLLRCIDSAGQVGEDTVEVVVWDEEEPIQYVISGGDTIYDWWSVDDDITVTVDGVEVFADTNHTADTHPPFSFQAEVGQTIEVVVTDYNYCDTYLTPLTLHFGTETRMPLFSGFCYSACPTHECYDADYAGPWPNVIFEDSAVIAIP